MLMMQYTVYESQKVLNIKKSRTITFIYIYYKSRKRDCWWIHKLIILVLIHILVSDLNTTPRTSITSPRSSPWSSWSCSSTSPFLHALAIWWTVCSNHRWLCRDTTVRIWVFSVTSNYIPVETTILRQIERCQWGSCLLAAFQISICMWAHRMWR